MLFLTTLTCIFITVHAQKRPETGPLPPKVAKTDNNDNAVRLALDSSVTTSNAITIKGQRVPYTATAGTIPVWDENGKPLAGVFYTYYERTDIKDL